LGVHRLSHPQTGRRLTPPPPVPHFEHNCDPPEFSRVEYGGIPWVEFDRGFRHSAPSQVSTQFCHKVASTGKPLNSPELFKVQSSSRSEPEESKSISPFSHSWRIQRVFGKLDTERGVLLFTPNIEFPAFCFRRPQPCASEACFCPTLPPPPAHASQMIFYYKCFPPSCYPQHSVIHIVPKVFPD